MNGTKTFGDWVKQSRRASGMTQANLALLMACSVETIKKIESNARRPSLQMAELLAQHLKIDPAAYQEFLALARPDLFPAIPKDLPRPASFSPRRSHEARSSRLPIPITTLIGREKEIAKVCSILQNTGVHMLTLTGAGGVGKTRLSLQVASVLRNQFADGVCFVSLSPISDPKLVIPTIAQKLEIKEANDQSAFDLLLDFLHDKELLLVLDNFEQVLPAASEVAELLVGAPGLKVIVTSRLLLHLYGEHEYIVAPLSLPDLRALPNPNMEELMRSPAVTLFVQRAQATRTDFTLTSTNALTIAKICARLDGLPLAIELAAARIKLSTPQTLLTQLEGGDQNAYLDVLARVTQDLPPRQQTMRAAIDWSYKLLNGDEQALFRRLGLFMGGCTLEAVTVVCTGWDASEAPSDASLPQRNEATMAALATLIDHSLLLRVEGDDGAPRFMMLETLREYALERLQACDELNFGRKRFGAYYLSLAERCEVRYHGPAQKLGLKQIETEQDNLRAVLLWSSTHEHDLEVGLKLLNLLCLFWLGLGHAEEGRAWVEKMLAVSATAKYELLRAGILNGAGLLAWAQSDSEYSLKMLEESLVIFRKLGDKAGYAWVLNHLGQSTQLQGDLKKATAYYNQSLKLFRELGSNQWGLNIAWALSNLGQVAQLEGEQEKAQAFCEESLVLFRELGDMSGSTWSLYHLGELAESQGNHQKAINLFNESLALFRSLDHSSGSAWSLYHLGHLIQTQHAKTSAAGYFLESLRLFRDVWDPWGIAWCLAGLANEASLQEDFARAAQLYGAVEVMLKHFGERQPPAGDRADYDYYLALTRASLDPQQFAENWEQGQALSSSQAIATALNQAVR